jgi:hypothetical protein
MGGVLGVGHPAPSVSGGIDLLILVWAVVALLTARFVLSLRLTIPIVATSLITATLWWGAVQTWGLLRPTALLGLGVWAVSRVLVVRRHEG